MAARSRKAGDGGTHPACRAMPRSSRFAQCLAIRPSRVRNQWVWVAANSFAGGRHDAVRGHRVRPVADEGTGVAAGLEHRRRPGAAGWQRPGGGSAGASRARASRTAMPGWLVMTAGLVSPLLTVEEIIPQIRAASAAGLTN